MPLSDTPESREILRHLFPGIEFQCSPKPSGQRLVYFCSFPGQTDVESQQQWAEWGAVVLKTSEDLHPTVIARLEKEREILNGMSSPYFPRLLYSDVFSYDPVTEKKFPNRLFVTIEERVDGKRLDECRAHFASEPACLNLLRSLIGGLQLLWNHPQRIIHRDLKPDNIIVRPNGSPVIIDLGIVREEGSVGVTFTHMNMGPCTPGYASPEQLRNQKRFITFKSDLFSLGVIAYELLSGKNPFMPNPYEPLESLVSRVITYDPPSLASLGVASPELSAVVSRLMAKEPYQRPRTVGDVVQALGQIAGENE